MHQRLEEIVRCKLEADFAATGEEAAGGWSQQTEADDENIFTCVL